MKPKYSMLIRWSDEDDCYIVYLPEFGCYGGHADTYAEAAAIGEDAIKSLVNVLASLGRKKPKPIKYGAIHTITTPEHETKSLQPDWYEKTMVKLQEQEPSRTTKRKKKAG